MSGGVYQPQLHGRMRRSPPATGTTLRCMTRLQEREPQFKTLQADAESDLDSTQADSAASNGSATETSPADAPPASDTRASADTDITGEPKARTETPVASDDNDTHQSGCIRNGGKA